jgi:hypothetical protein
MKPTSDQIAADIETAHTLSDVVLTDIEGGVTTVIHVGDLARRLATEVERLIAERDATYELGPHPVEQARHIPLPQFIKTRFVQVWECNKMLDDLRIKCDKLEFILARVEGKEEWMRKEALVDRSMWDGSTLVRCANEIYEAIHEKPKG